MKICIVGLGNMGKAIFEVLKKNGFSVSGCEKGDDTNKAIFNCDVFIIAVKPQSFEEFAKSIKIDLKEKLAISIMAGVTIKKIQRLLKMKKVVRTMPNLPLKVGKALTGWTVTKNVPAAEKLFAKKILRMFGEEIEVKKEADLDSITAISGCGPAYFFVLTSLLEKKAIKYGFPKADAKKMAESVFIGSAYLFKNEKQSADEMIKRIASKKGSTEQALKYFKKNGLGKVFFCGIEKAKKRAKQLNN